ncbi:hypothetical protein Tco_0356492 [Tanacetum coccineum]
MDEESRVARGRRVDDDDDGRNEWRATWERERMRSRRDGLVGGIETVIAGERERGDGVERREKNEMRANVRKRARDERGDEEKEEKFRDESWSIRDKRGEDEEGEKNEILELELKKSTLFSGLRVAESVEKEEQLDSELWGRHRRRGESISWGADGRESKIARFG